MTSFFDRISYTINAVISKKTLMFLRSILNIFATFHDMRSSLVRNYIKNYPCVLYTWSSFGTAELKCCEINLIHQIIKIKYQDEKKVKKLSERLICILYIKHSLLQEIKADTFWTTITSLQKLINAGCY